MVSVASASAGTGQHLSWSSAAGVCRFGVGAVLVVVCGAGWLGVRAVLGRVGVGVALAWGV